MSDGNKRYLGDVWINQENLDRQREFFRDILESYQYKYGGDFDAATLQGKDPTDFATAEQGAMAENAIQAPLLLGKKEIANVSDPQYIYTDAIRLYQELDTEEIEYQFNNHPWYGDLLNQSLSSALLRIYDKVMEGETRLQQDINTKLDEEEYQDFITNDFSPLQQTIQNSTISYINEDTQEETHGLNASLVNGIRPILITRAKYEALKNGTEEEQALVNHWRNVFIFVENLPPDYNAPWEYSLTDPYSFRVNGNYLQVTNNLDGEWKNVATLSSFLNGANFDDVIKDYIENSNDFEIGTTSLLNSLSAIEPTTIDESWEDYPFLSSHLHDDFVKSITLNNSLNYVTETLSNSFKTVNIDVQQILKDNEVLDSNGLTKINNIQATLDNTQTNLNNARSTINTMRTQINAIDTTNSQQNTKISSIESQLDSLRNLVTNLINSINSVSNSLRWTEYPIRVTGAYAPTVHVYYNQYFVTIKYAHPKGDYIDPAWNAEFTSGILPNTLRPTHPVGGVAYNAYVVYSIRDKDGNIYLRSLNKGGSNSAFWFNETWPRRGNGGF